jgi:hypothetical protein
VTKDVKKMVAEIRGALDGYPREQLQEMLAYVFKEYVVESGAPATGALSMLDARTELEGLSFAELMTWLQLHLDVPELALFEVANGRVSLRSGGRAIAIEAARAGEPAPLPMPAPQPSSPLAPVRIQSSASPPGTTAAPAPPPQTQPPPTPQSNVPASSPQPMPPPLASPAGGPTTMPASNPPPTSQPKTQQPATPASTDEKKDESAGGDANSRFSWLEVD